jgi:hypothetical protein
MSKIEQIDYLPFIRIAERRLKLTATFEPEYYFLKPDRNHRFDFALPCCSLAIEVNGGIFLGKGHTGGVHFQSDMWKLNQAQILGWRVLQFTPKQIEKFDFLTDLRQFFYTNPCTHAAQNSAWSNLLSTIT